MSPGLIKPRVQCFLSLVETGAALFRLPGLRLKHLHVWAVGLWSPEIQGKISIIHLFMAAHVTSLGCRKPHLSVIYFFSLVSFELSRFLVPGNGSPVPFGELGPTCCQVGRARFCVNTMLRTVALLAGAL